MKSIIKREATFENNSDMEVKVRQKQLSRWPLHHTAKLKCVALRLFVCLFVCCSTAHQHYLGH